MACRETDRVVEEEEWGPSMRAGERPLPSAELRATDDPQRAAVVPYDPFLVVDHAAAISGEHPAPGDGVEIAPRIDSIAARHGASIADASVIRDRVRAELWSGHDKGE